MPGPVRDGDSYRCELAGLIGIMVIINAISKAHSVTSGQLTVACDNISTLRIFNDHFIPEPTAESFDLVCCLHKQVTMSTVKLTATHVKGHAVDRKPRHRMTRLETLNDEMDHTAKAFWNSLLQQGHTMEAPMMHVDGEGWSIWKDNTKIPSTHQKALYPHLEDHRTLTYWTQEHYLQPQPRIPPQAIHNIDWDACEHNMRNLGFARQLWTSKRGSENCGVGITQLTWGKQTTDACPRCGLPEDTKHTLICTAEAADVPWSENMSKLETYLKESHTHPSIQAALLSRLSDFRSDSPILFAPAFPMEVNQAVAAQDQIGWKNLLEGLPAKQWTIAQARHCRRNIITHITARHWMRGLLKCLRTLAWSQWKHRNDVMYEPNLKKQQEARSLLHQEIISEYGRGPADLPPRDCSHFATPLMPLLAKSLDSTQTWLVNITAARHRQARRRGEPFDNLASSPARDKVLDWCKTRRFV